MGNLLNYKGTVQVRPTWITDAHIVDRQSDGSPKLVVGVTGAKTVAGSFADYEERRLCPHATYDAETDTMYQHIPNDKKALIVSDHLPKSPASIGTSFWVLVVGLEAHHMPKDQVKSTAKMIKKITEELDIPLEFGEFLSQGVAMHSRVITYADWKKTSGVISTTVTPQTQFASFLPEEVEEMKIALKIKKSTKVPSPDEIEIVQPEPKEEVVEEAPKETVVEEEKVIEIPEEAVNVEEVHAIAEALKAIGNVRG